MSLNPEQESDLRIALDTVSELLQTAKEECEGGNSELALKLVQQVHGTLQPFTIDAFQAEIDEEYQENS